MGYQTIEVRKLTPVIGAEIFGPDLSRPHRQRQQHEGSDGRPGLHH